MAPTTTPRRLASRPNTKAWSIPSPTTPRRSCRWRAQVPGCLFRTAPPTCFPWAIARQCARRGAYMPAWSADPSSGPSTRAGTCTRPSCPAATLRRTPFSGRGCPAQPSGSARTYTEDTPASLTSRRWPGSCSAASSAARSTRPSLTRWSGSTRIRWPPSRVAVRKPDLRLHKAGAVPRGLHRPFLARLLTARVIAATLISEINIHNTETWRRYGLRSTAMKILVVNVNTTASMTETIVASARSVASSGTEIVGLTPTFGAESVEGNFESYLAAVGVMDAVTRYQGEFDAVVQAGFGEHGREGLQELLDVPVVDITEAAGHVASLLGHKYSVVTTLDRAVPLIEDRLKLAGLDARCASVRSSGMSVLELDERPEAAVKAIVAEAERAVAHDGAEVICLGCGGMAGLDEAVAAATGVPVVDGVTAAVKLAEALIGLGLTTSKIRSFAPPRRKRVSGWPLSPSTHT